MTTWNDTAGRFWTIRLNCGNLKRLRDTLGVDLLDATKTDTIGALLLDPELLANTLWQLCESQAAAKEIDRAAFVESLDGDALSAGWNAIRESYVLFCPAPRRPVLRDLLDRQLAAMERIVQLATEATATPEFAAEMEETIQAATAELISRLKQTPSGVLSGK
jgi:hypothetical protein